MELLLLLGATFFVGYYTLLVWKQPMRLRQFLKDFYGDSWVKDVVSSNAAFWVVRLFVTIMFAICMGLLISGVLHRTDL